MPTALKRLGYAAWLALVIAFAAVHAVHLGADFPNHTPWFRDWAKYTDEGWYGNAAIRAHLFGHWYLPGDFNPAPAVPVWPFLEWLLFFLTGVTVEAARGLAVAFFFLNLLLSYILLRGRGPRWMPLLALTILATSPFLYCFSRLAILEPLLIALTLGALNLAVRLPQMSKPGRGAVAIGLLFTLMLLTKTTAVFLLPALAWAIWATFGDERRAAAGRSLLLAALASAASFGAWMALVIARGLIVDYRYLFYINSYPKPHNLSWPFVSLWWSVHGGLWVDHILIPLAGFLVLMAVAGRHLAWGRALIQDPVFAASVLVVAGYILFMTYQDHPQPRYFAVVFFFCALILAQGAAAFLTAEGLIHQAGWGALALIAGASATNAAWIMGYALHPEYTFVTAAQELTRYIDQHPNGNRLLVSISGDEVTLMTHLPSLCDDFSTPIPGMPDLPAKLGHYHPGWYAAWNDLDPGTLADLHTHFSLEQVASFHAMDDPERNVLVLFKLHPLAGGKVRDQGDMNLRDPLPNDRIEVPIE
ncbi:MAG: glycosyltransferase family 39 protein [Acidobacteriota bacterium]|nr:glycosyltransferase family 39 protein [Acidobacteriota bacterium]